ncbi:MAG: DUF456 domain-containing protein [Pseudomonadota bacterium]|nr:MAG: DUF456 domain-containing protein [Pseudomonadota bacterium]
MDASLLLWILAALLVIAGIAGLLLPALPGAPLLFAGLVVAAWADDFAYVGTGTIIVLGVLAALTYVADFVAGALGAKRFGASPRAVAGSIVGGIVGLFFGIPGVLIGPFVGAVIGELSVRRDVQAATRAGIGATIGLVLATAAKIAVAFTMIGLFLVMRLF